MSETCIKKEELNFQLLFIMQNYCIHGSNCYDPTCWGSFNLQQQQSPQHQFMPQYHPHYKYNQFFGFQNNHMYPFDPLQIKNNQKNQQFQFPSKNFRAQRKKIIGITKYSNSGNHHVRCGNTSKRFGPCFRGKPIRGGVKYHPGCIKNQQLDNLKNHDSQKQTPSFTEDNQHKNRCSSESDSQSQDETFFLEPNDQIQSKANDQLRQKGFGNDKTNIALLSYYQNDVSKVEFCLRWCKKQQAIQSILGKYQSNFLILQYLGYCKKLYYWKVLKVLQKNNNNLAATIQNLQKRVENIRRKEQVQQQVKNCKFNMLDQIPENCQFLIDGFNIVRANKHLKKLTKSQDLNLKLEAILRLKVLVQTLAPGYLVLDKKFLDDNAQKEILKQIDVNLEAQKKIQVIYADDNLKADDKIVQILQKMSVEQRKKVLLVTSDRLLIKQCQNICGQDLYVMGGKVFIKKCKPLLPKGIRNKVLKGVKKEKKQKKEKKI